MTKSYLRFIGLAILPFVLSLAACGGGSGSGSGGTVPAANSGPDQNVTTGTVVTLDGSGSNDADGGTLTYNWSFTSKPEGSSATISNSTVVNPTFTADIDGVYLLRLVVNDGAVDSNPDTVMVTVSILNSAPVAEAGNNQSASTGTVITLDGSDSSDADGDALTYNWSFTSKPVNSSAMLSDAMSATPSFVADVVGVYILSLAVNDGALDSGPDTVSITISEPNTTPVANGGPDQTIAAGSLISLDGSGSSDADGDALTYSWSFTSKPVNSSTMLSDAMSAIPSFVADVVGVYILSLAVNDGDLDSVADEVSVTVATGVGGIISSDVTWDLINSPYLITRDVQIAYGISLQIDEGVKVIGNNGKIKVFGILDAKGTKNAKIKFDRVNIVPGNGPADEWFKINIDYTEASSGSIYYPTGNAVYGSVSLKNSVLTNMAYMYLWYPVKDSFIEKNIFINSGGISIGHSNNIKVYIQNNVFYQVAGDNGQEYAIENWASYDTSETIVKYNSFLNTDRIALILPGGYTSSNITAINNYWNTTDTAVIEAMIYDKSDDLSSSGYITYSPFLTMPDPNTPDITPYLP